MRSIPCDICEIRIARKAYRILTNKEKITYWKLSPQGKRRRIKEGARHLLCERCEISAEWHGIVLEFIREGLTEKELSLREQKWKNKTFRRAIM